MISLVAIKYYNEAGSFFLILRGLFELLGFCGGWVVRACPEDEITSCV